MDTTTPQTQKQPIAAQDAAAKIRELAAEFDAHRAQIEEIASEVAATGRTRGSLRGPAGSVSVFFDSGWSPKVETQENGDELVTWCTTASVNWSALGSVTPERAFDYANAIRTAAYVASELTRLMSGGVQLRGRSAEQVASDKVKSEKHREKLARERAERLIVSAMAATKMVSGCRVNGERVARVSDLIFSDEELAAVKSVGSHEFTSNWSALGHKTYRIELIEGAVVKATRTE